MEFFSENRNIGLLCTKVRMFVPKSTALYAKEVRCFCFSGTEVFHTATLPSFSQKNADADKPEQKKVCTDRVNESVHTTKGIEKEKEGFRNSR